MNEWQQHLINGLSLGGVYALMAVGYTLVYGCLKFINFAHGDLLMVGAYAGYYALQAIGARSPLSWLAALTVAILCSSTLAVLMERIAYRRLRSAPRLNALITAIGVSLLLEFGGQTLFGADPKFFPQPLQAQSLPYGVLFLSFATAAVLQFALGRTRWGIAVRALSENAPVARLHGVPVDRSIAWVFAAGGALAGLAGFSYATLYPRIEPFMGVMPGLKCFAAAVLGGVGHIGGAALGALILGLSEEFLVAFGAASLRDALAFALLIFLLIARPQGIFGRRVLEKV